MGYGETLTRIYLGLGSNVGDRQRNLRRGVRILKSGLHDARVSSVYESEPVGATQQSAFLNLVLSGKTHLSAEGLLSWVKHIERLAGRVETYRWGPRVLDIDILLFGAHLIREPNLTIPHAELLHRAFVLVPLCEIAPTETLPGGHSPCRAAEEPALAGQVVRRLGSLEGCEVGCGEACSAG